MPELGNKNIGKFHEKRGEDYFLVNTSPDGDVIEIVQRDARSLTFPSINFFAESAPKLVALIQKAAGIKAEEYEYAVAVRITNQDRDHEITDSEWGTLDEARIELYDLQMKADRRIVRGGAFPFEYRIVKRRKAGFVEEVEG